ncbi:hypothetical protein ACIHFE_25645 [Streptomyces sp. NPDC052396]|uniref:hypothetical protein n=1 Tax=Streptomyces sp. NPDC052396 TaxID=3365689 RepID=UPI0037D86487
MAAGWVCRTVRAAVFAAACVLLTALGHAMMSGAPVPWWALTSGTTAAGGMAWFLAGRERGLRAVASAAVTTQAVLHSWFSLGQALVRPALPRGVSLARQWAWYLRCGPSGNGDFKPVPGMGIRHDAVAAPGHTANMGDMGGMGPMHSASHPGHLDRMSHAAPMDHHIAGMSSEGMLITHALAALVCALWLARGERAAFRILRALAGRLTAPLRPVPAPAAPPSQPRLRIHRDHSHRPLHRVLLIHAITSRGPPAGATVV